MAQSSEELLIEYNSWSTHKKIAGADVSPGAFLNERYLEALRRAMIRLAIQEPENADNYLDEEFHDRLAEDAASFSVDRAE